MEEDFNPRRVKEHFQFSAVSLFFTPEGKPGKKLGDHRYVYADKVAVSERVNNTLIVALEREGWLCRAFLTGALG
jgi:hypothetical protein